MYSRVQLPCTRSPDRDRASSDHVFAIANPSCLTTFSQPETNYSHSPGRNFALQVMSCAFGSFTWPVMTKLAG